MIPDAAISLAPVKTNPLVILISWHYKGEVVRFTTKFSVAYAVVRTKSSCFLAIVPYEYNYKTKQHNVTYYREDDDPPFWFMPRIWLKYLSRPTCIATARYRRTIAKGNDFNVADKTGYIVEVFIKQDVIAAIKYFNKKYRYRENGPYRLRCRYLKVSWTVG
jgi:uncharacterized protein YneR